MLNELFELAQSLDGARIETHQRHRFFQPLPKASKANKVLQVSLRAESGPGAVSELAFLPIGAESSGYLKWEPSKGNSFPAFKVHSLCRLPATEEARTRLKEIQKSLGKADDAGWPQLRSEIESLVALASDDWQDIEARTSKNLQVISKEVLAMLGERPLPAENRAIEILVERCASLTPGDLHAGLKRAMTNKALASPSEARDYLDLLLFFPERGRGEKETRGRDFQVLLDLADWNEQGCPYPPNHHQVQHWMNGQFLARRDSAPSQGDAASDAYGATDAAWKESFPQASLPILGRVTLRAMAAEIPSQKRYRMIEGGSFKVGQTSRDAMHSALEWLAKPEREGKTWRSLASRLGSAVVLFAYPSEEPETAPEIASLIAGAEEAGATAGAAFEVVAERVVHTLNGIAERHADAQVKIFVLGKPDGHRTKVLAGECQPAGRFIEEARRWQHAATDIPGISIRTFQGAEGKKPVEGKPWTPSPAEMVWCLNTVWRHTSGAEKAKRPLRPEAAKGFDLADGLTLLLDEDQRARPVTARALAALRDRAAPLLSEIGHKAVRSECLIVDKRYGRQLLYWPCIIGILLHRHGMTKGGIMESVAYRIGRMMSLTDQLHYQYCMVVREGAVPPQLAGNALLSVAMDQPEKALALLWNRLRPYKAWADSLHKGEKVGLVKYFLAELGRIAEELSHSVLPTRCTDADRAQMLLGYLARPKKSDDPVHDTEEVGG